VQEIISSFLWNLYIRIHANYGLSKKHTQKIQEQFWLKNRWSGHLKCTGGQCVFMKY
jgi:hypothetical protein